VEEEKPAENLVPVYLGNPDEIGRIIKNKSYKNRVIRVGLLSPSLG